MKKLISLLLIFVMTCSFAMIVNAETKMTYTVAWYGYDYDEEEEAYKATSTKVTEVGPGEYVTAKISVPSGTKLFSTKLFIDYDSDVVSVVRHDESDATINANVVGSITASYAAKSIKTNKNTFIIITFQVKENPVKNLESVFNFRIATAAEGGEHTTAPNATATALGDLVYYADSEIAIDVADLTFNGLTEGGSKEFTVTPAIEGTDVKVTVENSSLVGAGTIYVATFDGEVLVDCQTATLADDTFTFSGLAGTLSTAKVFVWDANMNPLLPTPANVQ